MSFPYKHVLLVGATSGIGAALASRFIAEGISVTAVGRRQDRLDAFVKQHGSEKASSLVFDISDTDSIPKFAEKALAEYPGIDCVYLNAAIQRQHNFADPSKVSLPSFFSEINVNFLSQVALAHAFLPHLLAVPNSGLIFTGTHISLVPAFAMPGYSASKAALESFILCLREQVQGKGLKVINLSAPAVQTEIHDYEMGTAVGRTIGMPLDAFTDEAYKGFVSGEEDIYVGSIGGTSQEQFLEIMKLRAGAFERLNGLLRQLAAAAAQRSQS